MSKTNNKPTDNLRRRPTRSSRVGDRAADFIKSRGTAFSVITAALIAAVVIVNIILYTLTSLYGLYAYSKNRDDLTISGNTDRVFKNLPTSRGVTVTFCMDEQSLDAHQTGSFVHDTARQFARRYSFIKLRYVNLLTQVDQDGNSVDLNKYTKDMKGNEAKVLTTSVIFESEHNYFSVTDSVSSVGFAGFYVLNSSGYANVYSGEEIFASMVAWVLNDEHKTAYLTQNHGETADVALSNMLTCAGYYVDVVNLRRDEVPSDAGLVIISAPRYDFEKGRDGLVRAEIERLSTYMDRGGKLYVAIDPLCDRLPVLEEFLASYGMTMPVYESQYGSVRQLVRESDDSVSVGGMSFVATHAEGELSERIADNMTIYGSGRVLLQDVGRIETDPTLGAHPLLISSPSSVAMGGSERVDSKGGYTVAAYSQRENEDGSIASLFLIPGAVLSSSGAMNVDGYSNKDFLYSAFEELFDSSAALYGIKGITMYTDTALHGFTMKNARTYTALIMILPAALAVGAGVIVVKRKNR